MTLSDQSASERASAEAVNKADAQWAAEVERLRQGLRDVDRWVRADAPKSLILAGIADRLAFDEDDRG